MSDDQITSYLEEFWDVEVPGVVWDESGRTVVDHEAAVSFMLAHPAGN